MMHDKDELPPIPTLEMKRNASVTNVNRNSGADFFIFKRKSKRVLDWKAPFGTLDYLDTSNKVVAVVFAIVVNDDDDDDDGDNMMMMILFHFFIINSYTCPVAK